MDDVTRRTRYAQLRTSHPGLFVNPPGASVEILEDPVEIAAAETATAERLAGLGLPTSGAQTGVVFEDPYLLIIRDAVRWPGGRLGTYNRAINAGNAAGVVIMPALGPDLVMVRHFRHATRRQHLEFPRGFGTEGATADEDARRELHEEIGAVATRLLDLGVVYPDTGASATPVRLYFAEIAEYTNPEIAEGINAIELVSPGRLAELIRDEEITDGFTINAYARAVLRGLVLFPRA